MNQLWSAILKPRGPHYQSWRDILDSERVPLKSPQSVLATLGEEKNVEVYFLNLEAMTLRQRSRLVGNLAQKFGVPIYEIEAELNERGFPIRAADVIVSYSIRAVI